MSHAPVSPLRKTEQMGVCAQYVPHVYMKEIQTVTIRFFKSKSREKVEKIFILPFSSADLFDGKKCKTNPFFPSPFFLFQVILDTVS